MNSNVLCFGNVADNFFFSDNWDVKMYILPIYTVYIEVSDKDLLKFLLHNEIGLER